MLKQLHNCVLALRQTYGRVTEFGAPPEPTTDAQIRWHIWNMRKNISMLVVTNFASLLVF